MTTDTKIDFAAFTKAVEGKGFKAQSDGSMFYVVTSNGIKVEYKQGRGQTYTVAYGKPRAVCDAVYAAVGDGTAYTLKDRKPAGHFNLVGQGLDKYLKLLTLVEGVALPKAQPKAKAPKEPKAKGPKLIKAKPVKLVDKPKVTNKTVEEMADIKAKNLARLKAVGKKYAKGKFAESSLAERVAVDEERVRDELTAFENDLDSFKSPSFLTKDQVKYLV